jgi:hypothetical protein
MNLESLFQAALRETIQPLLKSAGFSKKGAVFRRTTAEVVHVIAIQKSRRSTAASIEFAVNLGVASKLLLDREGVDPAKVRADECHWWRRLTDADTESDSWWTVDGSESARRAADTVRQILHDRALPLFATLSSDGVLRDLWLAGKSPGLTEVQRLVNLAVLTSQIGPPTEAQAALRLLKAKAESNPLPVLMNCLRQLGAT